MSEFSRWLVKQGRIDLCPGHCKEMPLSSREAEIVKRGLSEEQQRGKIKDLKELWEKWNNL